MTRVIATIVLTSAMWIVNSIVGPQVMLTSSQAAGKQLLNGNAEYVESMWTMALVKYIQFSPIVWGLLTYIIWRPIIEKLILSMTKVGIVILALVVSSLCAQPSYAYYETFDRAEIYYITPNQTCFWIPDAGANKDSQVKFGSADYLKDRKVAAKAFKIDHIELKESGWVKNAIVPSGRLHCVERTPWARRWTAGATTGTSSKDESFKCQSKDGQSASIDLSISVVVTEETAYQYLYLFGTKPPLGNPTEPSVIFTSVLFAKDIDVVMDKFVQHSLLPIVCSKFATRTVDEINRDNAIMMAESKTEATRDLANVGFVTLSFGWGNITYDDVIQQSMDERFAAEKVQPVLATLAAKADIKVKEALAATLISKGIPMPGNLAVIPSNLFQDMSKLITGQK